MAISFDALPDKCPTQLIPDGKYIGVIANAEMKTPSTPGKPDYLSIRWAVTDSTGKSYGSLFDGLYESDSDYMKYKLKCFLTATDIDLGKTFELKDLCKVVKGKSAILNIVTDTKSEPARNQVNIFNEPYAKIGAADGFMNVPEGEDAEVPFNKTEQATADSAY
jgi:hypothetical protein